MKTLKKPLKVNRKTCSTKKMERKPTKKVLAKVMMTIGKEVMMKKKLKKVNKPKMLIDQISFLLFVNLIIN